MDFPGFLSASAPSGGWRMCPALILIFAAVGVAAVNSGFDDETPSFSREPQSLVARAGSKVVIQCHVQPPGTTVTWLYNGTSISPNSRPGMEISGGRLHIFSYRHRTRDVVYEGRYQCLAENAVGAILSREVTLQSAVIGEFKPDLGDLQVNVTEGNVALIPCAPPGGNPKTVTTFERNGVAIPEDSGRHVVLPSGALQISGVRLADQGVYRCTAHNPVSDQSRRGPRVVRLTVVSPLANNAPVFTWTPKTEVKVIKGHNLTLECVVEGSPVPVITWDKYGGQLPRDRYRQTLGNLMVYDMSKLDEGTYICRAHNGVGAVQVAVSQVEVLEPPIIQVPPTNQVVAVGESASFQCHVRGKPSIETRWYHNAQPITDDAGFITITDTALIINEVAKRHQGIYQCVARSDLGMTYAAGRLRVVERDAFKRGGNLDLDSTMQNEMQRMAPDVSDITPVIVTAPANTSVSRGGATVLPCNTNRGIQYGVNFIWLREGRPVENLILVNSDDPHKGEPLWSSGGVRTGNGSAVGAAGVTAGTDVTSPSGGGERSSETRFRVLPAGSLQILNAQPSDAGQYACVVWDDQQPGRSASATAYLLVTSDSATSGLPSELLGNRTEQPATEDITTETDLHGNADEDGEDDETDSILISEEVDNRGQGRRRDRPRDPQGPGRDRDRDRGRGRDRDRDREGRPRPQHPEAGENDEEEDEGEEEMGGATGEGRNGKKNKNRERDREGEAVDDVMIPPSAPVVSKLSDTSVMLEWTQARGGLPVTFFKVQYKELSMERRKQRWRTVDEDILDTHNKMYEVSGLKPGGTYRFRLVAVYSNNDNQHGPNSRKFTLETAPAHRPKTPSGGPVIVEARPMTSSMALKWQYLSEEWAPIEGFYLFYKVYDGDRDYVRIPVIGAAHREYVLLELRPGVLYSIRMTCFNGAGQSPYSNTVVQQTLAVGDPPRDIDWDQVGGVPVHPGGADPHATPTQPGQAGGEDEEIDGDLDMDNSTESSSEMLYLVLGIVLGVMVLLLLVFMLMCGWKQRQQRRLLATTEGRHKFHDPARTIYAQDSLRKKHMNGGGFLLNGLNGVNGVNGGPPQVANGHVLGSYGNGIGHASTNSNSHMNINVNPMTQLDNGGVPADNKQPTHQSIQELRASLQELLQSPPPPPPAVQYCGSHSACDSPRSVQRHHGNASNNGSYMDAPYMSTFGRRNHGNHASNHSTPRRLTTPQGDLPPDYSSLNSRSRDPYASQRSEGSHDSSSYRVHDPFMTDYIPRSHDRVPHRSADNQSGSATGGSRASRDPGRGGSRDGGGAGGGGGDTMSEHSLSSASQVSSKHKRRRRKGPPSVTRDRSTNTDASSNDGTLDDRGCSSPPTGGAAVSPHSDLYRRDPREGYVTRNSASPREFADALESDIDTDGEVMGGRGPTPPDMMVSSCGEGGFDCPTPPLRLYSVGVDAGLGLGLGLGALHSPFNPSVDSLSDDDNGPPYFSIPPPPPGGGASAPHFLGLSDGVRPPPHYLNRVHDYSPSEQEEDDQ